MDREKAHEILNDFGRPSFKVGSTHLTFSRQTEENLSEIEAKSDEELIQDWKSLVWMNDIYGQVSLNDLQRIALIQLEMEDRDIPHEPLHSWYETELAKFDEQEFHNI